MAIDRGSDNGDATAPRPKPAPSQQYPQPAPGPAPERDPLQNPIMGRPVSSGTQPGIDYGAGNIARRGDWHHGYGRFDTTELGGYKGGANDIAGALSRQGAGYQNRTGPQINDPFAAQNRGLGMEARGQQGEALGLMRAAALGQAPSAAQIQMGQGIDASIAAQMAAANSARGGGANIALAQRNAAAQGSQMQTAGVNQSAALRAQEMAQARGAYDQAATNQRAQDLQLSGMDAQTAYNQAQLEAQQRAANDAMQRAYEGMGMDAQTAQLNANLQQYGADRGVSVATANRQSQDQKDWASAGLAAAGTLAMFSDIRAKTGIEPAGDGGYGLPGEAVTRRSEGATGGTPWAIDMSPGIQGPYAPNAPTSPRAGLTLAAQPGPSTGPSATPAIQASSPTPGGSPVMSTQPYDNQTRGTGGGLLNASQTLGGGYFSDERTKTAKASASKTEANGSDRMRPSVVLPEVQVRSTPGLVEPGNIDLDARPTVRNADGSISTVRSMGVNIGGQEVLIPTVSNDGRIMSDNEAVDYYMRTGQHLGKFRSPEDSTRYAIDLHNEQAKQYGAGSVYSDERLKRGNSHGAEADAFLETLKPYSYAYKDAAHEPTDSPHGGRYLGIMAQNVERGPTGDTLVKDTPNGKAIEGGAMLSALAAGEGRLHERMNRIDAILARKGAR